MKRYDFDNAESFQNINDSCSKNIYKNLVVNGYGEYGDNTNFPDFTYNSSTNDFKVLTVSYDYNNHFSNFYIPVDINKKYYYSMEAYDNSNVNSSFLYAIGFASYDIDKMALEAPKVMYIENTLTTLARDLKDGDTVVYFNDLSNWNIILETPNYQRGFIFWNYRDSTGYQYPELTYSQNIWYDLFTYNNINKSNNTITLNSPWSYGTFKAGTKLSQSNSGSTYTYSLVLGPLENSYKKYHNYITGTCYNHSSLTAFPIATKYIKFLSAVYIDSPKTHYVYYKNIVFEEVDE